MLSHSSNISNTSEAYTTRPKSEIKLTLPMNAKKRAQNKLKMQLMCPVVEKPVIGIRH